MILDFLGNAYGHWESRFFLEKASVLDLLKGDLSAAGASSAASAGAARRGPRPSAISESDPILAVLGKGLVALETLSASTESGPQLPSGCPAK